MSGFSNNSNVPLKTFLGYSNQSPTAVDVFDRRLVSNSSTLATGNIYFTFFTAPESIIVSNLTMSAGSIGSSGLTLCRMGLYSFDETTATRLAQTASDTTLFNTTFTNYTRAFDNSVATSVALVQGNRYGIAVIQVGTIIGSLYGAAPVADIPFLPPKINGALTGQTDLVASATGLIAINPSIYARLT